jgi:hypothetical protein
MKRKKDRQRERETEAETEAEAETETELVTELSYIFKANHLGIVVKRVFVLTFYEKKENRIEKEKDRDR